MKYIYLSCSRDAFTKIGLHSDGTEVVIKCWSEAQVAMIKEAMAALPQDLHHHHILLPKVSRLFRTNISICI